MAENKDNPGDDLATRAEANTFSRTDAEYLAAHKEYTKAKHGSEEKAAAKLRRDSIASATLDRFRAKATAAKALLESAAAASAPGLAPEPARMPTVPATPWDDLPDTSAAPKLGVPAPAKQYPGYTPTPPMPAMSTRRRPSVPTGTPAKCRRRPNPTRSICSASMP